MEFFNNIDSYMNELGQGLDNLVKELPKLLESVPQMVKELQSFIAMMEVYVWISGICLVALVIFSIVTFTKLNQTNQKLSEMNEKFNNLSNDIRMAFPSTLSNTTEVKKETKPQDNANGEIV